MMLSNPYLWLSAAVFFTACSAGELLSFLFKHKLSAAVLLVYLSLMLVSVSLSLIFGSPDFSVPGLRLYCFLLFLFVLPSFYFRRIFFPVFAVLNIFIFAYFKPFQVSELFPVQIDIAAADRAAVSYVIDSKSDLTAGFAPFSRQLLVHAKVFIPPPYFLPAAGRPVLYLEKLVFMDSESVPVFETAETGFSPVFLRGFSFIEKLPGSLVVNYSSGLIRLMPLQKIIIEYDDINRKFSLKAD